MNAFFSFLIFNQMSVDRANDHKRRPFNIEDLTMTPSPISIRPGLFQGGTTIDTETFDHIYMPLFTIQSNKM